MVSATLVSFYGTLATTASIFVGILTAYLVNRLLNLLSERSRIRQQVESIEVELEGLITRFDFRVEQLTDTEERWEREDAEEDVDRFIDYEVGSNWDPPVNQVTIDGAIDALIEYRNLTDGVTDYHIELLEERWGEIIDELRPRGFMELPTPSIDSDAVYIVEALWDIYDREKYDYQIRALGTSANSSRSHR